MTAILANLPDATRSVGIVIPVYRGERTLGALIEEILRVDEVALTPAGCAFRITEIILVHDAGPDESDRAIRQFAAQNPRIVPVWLTRNYGQHAATLAGIAASRAEWVVTLDEDGQHDPGAIPELLDAALRHRVHLIYASGDQPHGRLRRFGSRLARSLFARLSQKGRTAVHFSSFRLILGELARLVTATAGTAVYLDVALSWVIGRSASVTTELRHEGREAISYSPKKLVGHFMRMMVSLGPRPLGWIVQLGTLIGVAGLGFAGLTVYQRLTAGIDVRGWSSVMAVLLTGFGLTLIVLGVVARYIGTLVTIALGRPAYATVTDDSIVFR